MTMRLSASRPRGPWFAELPALAVRLRGLLRWFRRQGRSKTVPLAWRACGPTPLGERGYTPQGLTFARGKLIFANSWKDARSRVYEIDPGSGKILRTFDMPPEAVHTSGLAWTGQVLWAVDYKSNRAYCLDLEVSLSSGQAQVQGSFATTLTGTSACCWLPWQGEEFLVVSDFYRSCRTVFLRPEIALRDGTAAHAIAGHYCNEGFSQGLEVVDGYLLEAENKWGRDVINRLDVARLWETRDARASTVQQFPAPGRGVEDLAWDGQRLWTSDEVAFQFFVTNFLDHACSSTEA